VAAQPPDVAAQRRPTDPWACPSQGGPLEVQRWSDRGAATIDLAKAVGLDDVSYGGVADCAIVDADTLYVVTFGTLHPPGAAAPSLHAFVLFTHDGGAHWSRARLGRGEMTYTDWPTPPSAEISFTSAREGVLDLFDPPVHHNGHRGRHQRFRTRDGGARWERILDERDPPHEPG
jgi:hypothetical protein